MIHVYYSTLYDFKLGFVRFTFQNTAELIYEVAIIGGGGTNCAGLWCHQSLKAWTLRLPVTHTAYYYVSSSRAAVSCGRTEVRGHDSCIDNNIIIYDIIHVDNSIPHRYT